MPSIAPEAANGRTVVAHLGNGTSLCALASGRSIASTMGFTAVDGLMMGTRCGNLNPGVILFMLDELRIGMREIEDVLYRQSGLLGVSGVSSDMRVLLASDNPRAHFAVAVYLRHREPERCGLRNRESDHENERETREERAGQANH